MLLFSVQALNGLSVHTFCAVTETFVFQCDKHPRYRYLATSEMWCWSGGRGILTELSLCYSIVYYYTGPQWYEQFVQVGRLGWALILLRLALPTSLAIRHVRQHSYCFSNFFGYFLAVAVLEFSFGGGGHWGGDTFIWWGTQLILSCWTTGYVIIYVKL